MACYASDLIRIATEEIGYLEKASAKDLDSKTANAGSRNYTKYARDIDAIKDYFNGRKQGYAWCAVFVSWCMIKAFGAAEAKRLMYQPNKSLGASCTYTYRYYNKNGRIFTQPAVGDQIFFQNSGGSIHHTGIVYDVDKTYVYTIEGNTSSASGVVDNGGAVAKKKYRLNNKKIAGYGRPVYDESKSIVSVETWQIAAIADGYKFPRYGADGEWGAECESVAKKAICKRRLFYTNKNLTKIVQANVGVEVDGLYGKDTEAAVKAWQKAHGLKPDGKVGINTWKCMLNV